MSAEFGVTSGHSLYSTHRFREDTKHMVIFETLVKTDAFEPFQYDLYTDDGNSHNRTRLYLTEDAYAFTLRMEETQKSLRFCSHSLFCYCIYLLLARDFL